MAREERGSDSPEQRWSHTSYAVAQTLVNRCFSNVTHPLAEYCCHIHNGRVPVQLTMQMMEMLISRSAVFCIFLPGSYQFMLIAFS